MRENPGCAMALFCRIEIVRRICRPEPVEAEAIHAG